MKSAFGIEHGVISKIAAQPVYHGTTDAAWRSIKRLGLSRKLGISSNRHGGAKETDGTFVSPNRRTAEVFGHGFGEHVREQPTARVIQYNVVGVKPKRKKSTSRGVEETVYSNKDLDNSFQRVSSKKQPKHQKWNELFPKIDSLPKKTKSEVLGMKREITQETGQRAPVAPPPTQSVKGIRELYKRNKFFRGVAGVSHRDSEELLSNSKRTRQSLQARQMLVKPKDRVHKSDEQTRGALMVGGVGGALGLNYAGDKQIDQAKSKARRLKFKSSKKALLRAKNLKIGAVGSAGAGSGLVAASLLSRDK